MTDYSELKRLAEVAQPENCGFMPMALFAQATSPAAVLELIAQVERLERKNDNQAQTIREYSDLVMGGDVSLGMLRADLRVTSGERDQLKAEIAGLKTGYAAYEEEVRRLLEALSIAEEGLREVGENHDSTLAFLLAKRAREVIAVAKEAGQ